MKVEKSEKEAVLLDLYNSDLNLVIDASQCSAHPLTNEGFAFMWAGARATHGVRRGKVCYEVKIGEHLDVSHLPQDEPNPHVLRVGFSVESSSMQLGEEPLSYGYGGSGKISTNCQFKDYGLSFRQDDVILAALNMDSDPIEMGFAKNGRFLGWAYKINRRELQDKALYPHILTKNCSFEVNFGQRIKPFCDPPNAFLDFKFIGQLPIGQLERGSRAPERREDCEMIMMCGLPGAGKSVWAAAHAAKHPEKKFNVLGTNNIIDKMKVMGLPRKRNYAGRWDVLIKMATKCLNKLFEIGSKLRRNYILDQTNVYPTAQRRKMRNFDGFHRKAVVIVPTDEEYRRRCAKREKEEGKEIPDEAVLEMKANFKLPEVSDVIDEVVFTELQRKEAEELVRLYNDEGRAATGSTNKRFRPSDQQDSGPVGYNADFRHGGAWNHGGRSHGGAMHESLNPWSDSSGDSFGMGAISRGDPGGLRNMRTFDSPPGRGGFGDCSPGRGNFGSSPGRGFGGGFGRDRSNSPTDRSRFRSNSPSDRGGFGRGPPPCRSGFGSGPPGRGGGFSCGRGPIDNRFDEKDFGHNERDERSVCRDSPAGFGNQRSFGDGMSGGRGGSSNLFPGRFDNKGLGGSSGGFSDPEFPERPVERTGSGRFDDGAGFNEHGSSGGFCERGGFGGPRGGFSGRGGNFGDGFPRGGFNGRGGFGNGSPRGGGFNGRGGFGDNGSRGGPSNRGSFCGGGDGPRGGFSGRGSFGDGGPRGGFGGRGGFSEGSPRGGFNDGCQRGGYGGRGGSSDGGPRGGFGGRGGFGDGGPRGGFSGRGGFNDGCTRGGRGGFYDGPPGRFGDRGAPGGFSGRSPPHEFVGGEGPAGYSEKGGFKDFGNKGPVVSGDKSSGEYNKGPDVFGSSGDIDDRYPGCFSRDSAAVSDGSVGGFGRGAPSRGGFDGPPSGRGDGSPNRFGGGRDFPGRVNDETPAGFGRGATGSRGDYGGRGGRGSSGRNQEFPASDRFGDRDGKTMDSRKGPGLQEGVAYEPRRGHGTALEGKHIGPGFGTSVPETDIYGARRGQVGGEYGGFNRDRGGDFGYGKNDVAIKKEPGLERDFHEGSELNSQERSKHSSDLIGSSRAANAGGVTDMGQNIGASNRSYSSGGRRTTNRTRVSRWESETSSQPVQDVLPQQNQSEYSDIKSFKDEPVSSASNSASFPGYNQSKSTASSLSGHQPYGYPQTTSTPSRQWPTMSVNEQWPSSAGQQWPAASPVSGQQWPSKGAAASTQQWPGTPAASAQHWSGTSPAPASQWPATTSVEQWSTTTTVTSTQQWPATTSAPSQQWPTPPTTTTTSAQLGPKSSATTVPPPWSAAPSSSNQQQWSITSAAPAQKWPAASTTVAQQWPASSTSSSQQWPSAPTTASNQQQGPAPSTASQTWSGSLQPPTTQQWSAPSATSTTSWSTTSSSTAPAQQPWSAPSVISNQQWPTTSIPSGSVGTESTASSTSAYQMSGYQLPSTSGQPQQQWGSTSSSVPTPVPPVPAPGMMLPAQLSAGPPLPVPAPAVTQPLQMAATAAAVQIAQAPVAQAATAANPYQQQWAQYYQQLQQSYFNPYYGQQMAAAAPAPGSGQFVAK